MPEGSPNKKVVNLDDYRKNGNPHRRIAESAVNNKSLKNKIIKDLTDRYNRLIALANKDNKPTK